jgi:methylmalonyl-CoA mutase N-terminal domain/subunit
VIVGVNKFADAASAPDIPSPDYSALERAQVERLRAVRARRPAEPHRRALAALGEAAAGVVSADAAAKGSTTVDLMPLIIDAVRARASVGEIADVLESHWGRYRG